MQGGKLRHLITIQWLLTTQEETTGVTAEVWQTFAELVPAEVRPVSVREFIQGGISQSKVMTPIKIRYIPGIKPSMRILYDDRIFNIEGVLADPKSGREWLTLPCSEVQNG